MLNTNDYWKFGEYIDEPLMPHHFRNINDVNPQAAVEHSYGRLT